MHVNLSAVEIYTPGLRGSVLSALEMHGLAPRDLVLEITESQLLVESAALETLRALRATGVRLALDDFGTGYSSFAYLADLPLDMLKIPKPFIDRLSDGGNIVVQKIFEMAGALGLEVVAEGVETQAQYAALEALGSVLVQGYYLGRPVPEEELELATVRSRGVRAA